MSPPEKKVFLHGSVHSVSERLTVIKRVSKRLVDPHYGQENDPSLLPNTMLTGSSPTLTAKHALTPSRLSIHYITI